MQFIRVFHRLFDVLNSRNPLARNFKAPITKSNYLYRKSFLDETHKYIRNLKCSDAKPILMSKRKTGFLGFFVCIDAVLRLYKMSQDDLELFFSAVRASRGWSNNPTTCQFITAYKQLLMQHNIKGGRGNCIAQDETEILRNVKDQCEINSSPTGISDVAIARRYNIELRQPETLPGNREVHSENAKFE